MPWAKVNSVNLYYEVTGDGFPVVFSHEFAGDYRSWEPQVRFFSRWYRVITYNNRGYPPSEVPENPEAYSELAMLEDLYQLLRHLSIEKAHIIGLSMGGNVALHFGLNHPEMCASLVVAGCGAGSMNRKQFEHDVKTVAQGLEKDGMRSVAEIYSRGPTRVQFLRKNPKGWKEFYDQFVTHSAIGSALTFRGVQLRRPSIFDLQEKLKALTIPTFILIGDEDEPCIEPAIFMKRQIPISGLAVLPQTGHTLNLEDPDLFNRVVHDFLITVEAGKWLRKDPASVQGVELLRKD